MTFSAVACSEDGGLPGGAQDQAAPSHADLAVLPDLVRDAESPFDLASAELLSGFDMTQAPDLSVAPRCSDNMQDGNETDADCGGSCPRCAFGKNCLQNGDCISGKCAGRRCVSAMPLTLNLAAPTRLAAGAGPRSVTIADFDANGKPDLAVANSTGNTVSVLLGQGGATFGRATNFPTGTNPWSVAAADLDGNGLPDLVTGNNLPMGAPPEGVSALLGRGGGAFQAANNHAWGQVRSMIAGDFDRDGNVDLVFASSVAQISLNKGGAMFQDPIGAYLGRDLRSIAVGDFNSDGKSDVAVANGADNNMVVLFGQGMLAFLPPALYAAGSGAVSIAIGDLNQDGSLDLAVANAQDNNVSVFFNNGKGVFQPASNQAVGTEPWSVAVADLDGDGKLDIVTANYQSGNVSVLRNQGAGMFKGPANFPAGASPSSVAAGDLDSDGKPDLAVTNLSSDSVSVMLNVSQ